MRAPHALASEAITAINRWHIFNAKIHIALDWPVVDAAMAPDHASTPCETITLRLSPRPCCGMLPRLSTVDAVDEHHSTTSCHHLVAAPKMMPQRGRMTQKRATIVWSRIARSGVSPGATWASEHRRQRRWPELELEFHQSPLPELELQQGNNALTSPSPTMTRVRARLSPVTTPPPLYARTRCEIKRSPQPAPIRPIASGREDGRHHHARSCCSTHPHDARVAQECNTNRATAGARLEELKPA
jgi:hypothetical protein